jgi:predicted nucleotidyltransferase
VTKPELQNLLIVLRDSFRQILGEQFDRMLLFGSRARGDEHPDSDIDLLIIVHGPFEHLEMIMRTSELIARLSLENDVVISTVFMSNERFEHGGSPFVRNVRREGVLV